MELRAGLPWPERVCAALLDGELEVVCVHAPLSDRPGLAKVLTLEALAAHLSDPAAGPPASVLCGDLDTPRSERPDGTLLTGLPGYRDAFRALHGYERREQRPRAVARRHLARVGSPSHIPTPSRGGPPPWSCSTD